MNELAVQEKKWCSAVSARELLKYGFEDGTDFTSVEVFTLVNKGIDFIKNVIDKTMQKMRKE